eukprot:366496-Chlamydomonas_euryale.AAC.23
MAPPPPPPPHTPFSQFKPAPNVPHPHPHPIQLLVKPPSLPPSAHHTPSVPIVSCPTFEPFLNCPSDSVDVPSAGVQHGQRDARAAQEVALQGCIRPRAAVGGQSEQLRGGRGVGERRRAGMSETRSDCSRTRSS